MIGNSKRGRRRLSRWTAWMISTALFPVSGETPGETATFGPAADTTLLESAPDFNMGAEFHVAAGTTGSMALITRNRGLFLFDVRSIPPGSQISEATITFTVTGVPGPDGGGGPVNSVFALHRVHQPWGEGDKLGFRGEFATSGEATWNHASRPDPAGAPGIAWNEPGGRAPEDFSEIASGTRLVAGIGSYLFGSTPELVSDLQFWVDHPQRNFGWLLVSQAEETRKTARRFASREDAEQAPVLTVSFHPPAPIWIEEPRLDEDAIYFSFVAPAGRELVLESRQGMELGGDWVESRRFAVDSAPRRWEVREPIEGSQRFFRIRSELSGE